MKQREKRSRAPESSVLDYIYHTKSALVALYIPWPVEAGKPHPNAQSLSFSASIAKDTLSSSSGMVAVA